MIIITIESVVQPHYFHREVLCIWIIWIEYDNIFQKIRYETWKGTFDNIERANSL